MGHIFSKPRRIAPVVQLNLTREEIQHFFDSHALFCAPEAKLRYITVTEKVSQTIKRLSQHPSATIAAAASAFNTSFHTTAVANNRVSAADGARDDRTVLQKNIISLTHQVAAAMDAGVSMYKLVYHNKLHAYEMAVDVSQDCKKHPDFQLLQFICALYHDIQFTHQRVIDEGASVQACLVVLQPVLANLSQEQANIIRDLIEVVILAGTIPCMLNKNKEGEESPTMPSLFEVLNTLSPGLSEQYPLIAALCRSIARMDVQRTSVPETYMQYDPYPGICWDKLNPVLERYEANIRLSLQRKLTQNLRTLCEMELRFKGDSANPLIRYAYAYQQDHAAVTPALTEEDIVDLANKLAGENNSFSEASFAQRMQNTGRAYPGCIGEDFQDTWSEHIGFLTELARYLKNPSVLLHERADMAVALAQAARYQDGLFFDPACLPYFAAQPVTIVSTPRCCC